MYSSTKRIYSIENEIKIDFRKALLMKVFLIALSVDGFTFPLIHSVRNQHEIQRKYKFGFEQKILFERLWNGKNEEYEAEMEDPAIAMGEVEKYYEKQGIITPEIGEASTLSPTQFKKRKDNVNKNMTNSFSTPDGEIKNSESISEMVEKISEADFVSDVKIPFEQLSVIQDATNNYINIMDSGDQRNNTKTRILLESSIEEISINSDEEEVPSISRIIKFSLGAMGIWLCSPLLSLIDTSAVGLLSGTAQQAALNPAVAVTEYSALLMAFMYTGTTNVVASAQESDRIAGSNEKTASALRGSLQLSTFVGIVLGSIILFSSEILLHLIVGKNSNVDPIVTSAALKYIRIRALGMPAAAITGSAQAACLGMKDTRSPLVILVLAASVNFLSDMILVRSSNAWIGGCAGAAWATVFSQYAALFLFMGWLTKKENDAGNISRTGILQKLFPSKSPTKGLLRHKMSKRNLLTPPPSKVAKKFWPYFFPVTTTSAGRVSGYVAMAHVISSVIGTTAMAAQQVILSFFYCLCPPADSISLVGQSYTPALMKRIKKAKDPEKVIQNANSLRKLTSNIFKTSILFSFVTIGAVSCMPFLSCLFTSDVNVISQVRTIVPFIAIWFACHSPGNASEGILLGRQDLGYLGKIYGLFFVILPFFILRIKYAALGGKIVANLSSVWKVFITYGFIRCLLLVGRMLQQTMRTVQLAKEENKKLRYQEEVQHGCGI